MLHDSLWQENLGLAEACLKHSFVRGLADGSLEQATFRRYVAQDAFFLDAFARAYALALAKCRHADLAALFHELLAGVQDERKLHKAYAGDLAIDLDKVTPNPACSRYTDFLLATAWHRDVDEILAAMTPCMGLYAYLGERVRGEVGGPDRLASHLYGRWIETYSAAGFRSLTVSLEDALDRTATDSPLVRSAYRYAMRCELDFFEDAWVTGTGAT